MYIGCFLIDLVMLIVNHSVMMRFASPATRGFLSPLLSLSSLFMAKENLWDQGIIQSCSLHGPSVVFSSSQVVGPASGADYVIDYYGPRLIHISQTNETFYKPQELT